jgi:hypothetical protein
LQPGFFAFCGAALRRMLDALTQLQADTILMHRRVHHGPTIGIERQALEET